MATPSAARRRLRGWTLSASPWLLTLLGVGAVVVLLALTLVGFRLARPGVLPNLEVAGHELGGHDRAQLQDEVERISAERTDRPVTVVLETDEERRVTSSRSALGYQADPDTTAEEAWRRGRQANPLAALADHVRAFRGIDVPLAESLDERALQEWVDDVAAELDHDPVEGEVSIDGVEVGVVAPEPGASVDRDGLRGDAAQAALAPGEQRVVASNSVVEPRTDADNVAETADLARLAVSEGVRLDRGEAALELSAEEISSVLGVERLEGDEGVWLELVADADALQPDEETLAALETEPEDARIQLVDGEVEITPSVEGFEFDPEIAAGQVLELATSEDERTAELRGRTSEPELTTADAEALEVTERVASFTTHHACCQGRVQNIQRMADIVRGALVLPGEEFSLNEHVGPRTRAKGFTDGGMILRGEFEDVVGGGVSQFGTTFFGAAYEGGYEILDHRPHSYYISRYPMGREATLNYPELDVRLRNDSPYGLLIHTRYTPTSITVDFYGKEWVEVEEFTSPRRSVRPPPKEYEENPDLEPGTEQVVQQGREGFLVTYTRRRRFPDGSDDEESWAWRYTPEPRIIERNTEEPEDDEDEDEDDGDEQDEDDD